MEALKNATTEVYEPMNKFHIHLPESTIQVVLNTLSHYQLQIANMDTNSVEGIIHVEQALSLERKIPELTGDQGMFTSEFESYPKIRAITPTRKRTDNNPLDKKEYMGEFTKP
jgi:ribosomal protection tetracycline resistance protein